MYANKVKKVVAVHDLSGVGRVSLTIVIPILSSMGFQVCPLPTAVLSSHTQYPNFSFLDLTEEMPKIISEWKKLGMQFDAFYTGYLGSPLQIQIVSDFIDDFRQPESLVVVDPVLGDNGKLYANFHDSMIKEMRQLITKADVITPNLTELFYLLDFLSYPRLESERQYSGSSFGPLNPEGRRISGSYRKRAGLRFPIGQSADTRHQAQPSGNRIWLYTNSRSRR